MQEPTFGPGIGVSFEMWEGGPVDNAKEEIAEFSKIFPKIISGEYEIKNYNEEFLARLFPLIVVWEDFDNWHRYFEEINYFPSTWNGLEGSPPKLSDTGQDYLIALAKLSLPARRLLVNTNYYKATKQKTKKVYEFRRQSNLPPQEYEIALKELTGNFVSREVDIADRLRLLRVKDLKPILEDFDLKKSGRKNDLVERLAENVPEIDLKPYLTEESKQNLITNTKWLPSNDSQAIEYHDKKIQLLAHSLRSLRYTQQNLDRAVELGVDTVEINPADNCPVCYPKRGKVKLTQKNLKKLPPFHPGCRCHVSLNIEGLSTENNYSISEAARSSKSGCLSAILIVVFITMLIFFFFF